ncbi:MAG: DUF1566 domain-containing protein [Candidatus Aminicenantes bacterium]|jgi:hypothetical protein
MKRRFCILIITIVLLIPFKLIPVKLVKLNSVKIGKQYLVLIAVNKYEDWNRLKGPVKDAEEIRKILESHYYIDDCVKLYDEKATKKGIIGFFKDLQKKLKEDDSLLIFYAGHGHLDNASDTGYWIPVDGGSDKDERVKWVPYSTLIGLIENIRSKHILLISDSCFSGDILKVYRAGQPKIGKENFRRDYELRCRLVITSGSSERVPDSSEFARKLILTLQKNSKSFLTALTLYERIRDGMERTSPRFGEIRGTNHQSGAIFLLFLRGTEEGTKKEPVKIIKPELPDSKPQEEPTTSTTSTIDLSDIKKTGEKEKVKKAKERGAWSDWLEKFQEEFKKIEEIDFDTEIPPHAKKEAWVRLLKAYHQDNPFSEKDDRLKTYSEKRIKYWEEFGIPETLPIPKEPSVRLRSQHKKMSKKDVKEMVIKYNFYSSCLIGVSEKYCNPDGSFNNQFVSGKKVVVDMTTGLMWDRLGTVYRMKYEKTRDWIKEMNRNKYAGYNDWRLPTLEEGASLLSKKVNSSRLCTDELFSKKQIVIWTVDPYIPSPTYISAVWEVDFYYGIGNRAFWEQSNYVRAVRIAR